MVALNLPIYPDVSKEEKIMAKVMIIVNILT